MALTEEISPQRLQKAVHRGAERLANFRAARVFTIKEMVGPYYDAANGAIGTRAINLLFNMVRVLVPTLVLDFPKHEISTPYLAAREYANLLALALSQHDLQINITDIYRRAIVDAIFTIGILKTGLAQSDSVYVLDDDMGQESLDNGSVYTECVDFDNFVVDPACKEYLFRDASFMGDRITIPRKMLLDSGLYKNDLIERLPRAGGDGKKENRASALSMKNIQIDDNYDLQDEVEIYEIWVPSANAIVTVPADREVTFTDYLRVTDYYGVKDGPYTFLVLTPPVPGNPLPVPLAGVVYDLHILANRMAKKIVDQAERQKDIVAYKATAADDAEQLKNAGDGEAVKVDDVDGVKTLSFGGQQNSNENHLVALEGWFNQLSGNVNQVGGQNIEAHSATASNILQQNSGIGLEDMRDAVYRMAAAEARKRCWYFHTDPLMAMPLTKRQPTTKGQMVNTPMGPQWLESPVMEEVQVILTPEARSGNYIDFTFSIEPESMGRRDGKTRLAQAMAFAQQILPAVAAAAQIFMSLGIPFSAIAFLLRMAKDSGITWMDEVVYDPQFQQSVQRMMAMGPQEAASKGTVAGQPNAGLNPSILQNGQPGTVQAPPQMPGNMNQEAQAGANDAQTEVRSALKSALRPTPAPRTASLF